METEAAKQLWTAAHNKKAPTDLQRENRQKTNPNNKKKSRENIFLH